MTRRLQTLLAIAAATACSTGTNFTTAGSSNGNTTSHHTTGASGSPSGTGSTGTTGTGSGTGNGVGNGTTNGNGVGNGNGNGNGTSGMVMMTPDGGCETACIGTTPYCIYGTCYECRGSTDCATLYPQEPVCCTDETICGSFFSKCVECVQTSDCTTGTCGTDYVCSGTGSCNSTGCTSGYCEPDSGACVECLNYTQCLPSQVCTNNTCGNCVEDSDCNPDSGLPICSPESRCAQCTCPPDAGGGVNTCPYADCPSGKCVAGDFTCSQ